jgi:hypothetical protein
MRNEDQEKRTGERERKQNEPRPSETKLKMAADDPVQRKRKRMKGGRKEINEDRFTRGELHLSVAPPIIGCKKIPARGLNK